MSASASSKRLTVAPFRRDAEALGEAVEQTLVDRGEIRQALAEQLAHRDDALPGRGQLALGELFDRHLERGDHLRGIEIDEQRALVEQRGAIEEAAGAADLAPVDLDVVARPVARRHAELVEPERRRLADPPRRLVEIAQAEARAVEDQLPPDLALVEIETAAAGDAPADLDAAAAAMIDTDLVAQDLVHADQRRGAEAQEADGVGNATFLARADERLVEGDVGAAAADAGVDHAEARAGHRPPPSLSSGRPRRSCRRILRTSRPSGWKGYDAMLLGGELP